MAVVHCTWSIPKTNGEWIAVDEQSLFDLLKPHINISYHDALKENISLVYNLFSSKLVLDHGSDLLQEDNSQAIPGITRFLDTYMDVFSFTQPAPLQKQTFFSHISHHVEKSVRKYLEVFRKQLRGITVLGNDARRSIHCVAVAESLKLLDKSCCSMQTQKIDREDMEVTLKTELDEMGHWIEKINANRKVKIVETITSELFSNFQETLQHEYPKLFQDDKPESLASYPPEEDGNDYYNSIEIQEFTNNLASSIIEDLKQQIKFEDDENEVAKLVGNLNLKLDQEKSRLLAKNEQNKSRQTEALFEIPIKESHRSYEAEMTSLLNSTPGHDYRITAIEKQHNTAQSTCLQQFQEISNEAASNLLKVRIFESFRGLVSSARVEAIKEMEACAERCKKDIANCLENLEEHLAKITSESPRYTAIMRSKMEKWLDETVQDATKGTIIKQDSMDSMLKRLAPSFSGESDNDKNSEKETRIKGMVTNAATKFKEMTDAARRKSGSAETKASYIRNQVKSKLEFEIKSEFGEDEPTEQYVKELETHMNVYIMSKMENAINNLDKKLDQIPNRPVQSKVKVSTDPSLLPSSAPEQITVKQEVNFDDFDLKNVNTATPLKNIAFAKVNGPVFHFKGNAKSPEFPKPTLLPTPLVFHFSVATIQMGVMDQSNTKHVILLNEFGHRCTPTQVGITHGGCLVYGNEIPRCSAEASLFRQVYLDQYFLKDLCAPESLEVVAAGKLHILTAEVLLGFLLRKLKATAEKYLRFECHQAVVVIPNWLASGQRVQVKDAAKVAGFSEVHLLNDVSAAAFAFVTNVRNSMIFNQGSNNTIAVLSETSNYVECVMYSVLDASFLPHVRIKMTGRVGQDQSEALRTKSKRNQPSEEVLKKIVLDMCKKALSQCPQPTPHGKTITPIRPLAVVVVCGEGFRSNFWRSVLESVRMEYTGNSQNFELNEKEAILIGGTLLSQNLAQIGVTIKDQLNFQLWRCQSIRLDNGEMRVTVPTPLNPTMGHLPVPGKHLSVQFCFPRQQSISTFYQAGMILGSVQNHQSRQSRIPIGTLEVFDSYPRRNSGIYKQFIAHLKINHEGIASLDYVLVLTRTRINNQANPPPLRYFGGYKRKRGYEIELPANIQGGKCVDYQRLTEGDGRISWVGPSLTQQQIEIFRKMLVDMQRRQDL